MNVAVLQKHLRDLAAFLADAEAGKSVVKDLTAIHDALTPFAAEELGKFADFLKLAEEYKRTGVLTPKGGKGKGGAATEPVVPAETLHRQLRDLYDRASTATDPQIDAALKPLEHKDVKLPALKQLAQAVEAEGRVKSLRAKDKAIAAIRQAIIDRRAMAQRGQQ